MSIEVSRAAEVPGSAAGPARVLVVLPVRDESPAALAAIDRAMASVAAQADEPADVVLVAPPGSGALREQARRWRADVVDDPGAGLAAAVNAGLGAARPQHRYVSWLTADDELLPGAFPVAAARLDARPDAVLAYGDCRFVGGGEEYLYTPHAPAPVVLAAAGGRSGPAEARGARAAVGVADGR